MRVGVENSIECRNVFTYRLRVEIRSGIDDDDLAVVFQHDRGTCAPVMRIAGMAHRAVAPQRRNSHRRSTSQDGQSSFHLPGVPVEGPGCGGRAKAFVTSTYAMRNS